MLNTQKQQVVHCPGFRLGYHGAQIANCHIRTVSWREALGVFSRTCERPTPTLQRRLTSLGTKQIPANRRSFPGKLSIALALRRHVCPKFLQIYVRFAHKPFESGVSPVDLLSSCSQ